MGLLVNGVGLVALLWFQVFVVNNVAARECLSFSKYEEAKTVIGGNDKGGDIGCGIGNSGDTSCGDYGGGAGSGRDGSGDGDYGCGSVSSGDIGGIIAPSAIGCGDCLGDGTGGGERKSVGFGGIGSGIGKGGGFGGEVGTGFGFGGGGIGHH